MTKPISTSISGAAILLGISRKSVAQLIDSGILRSSRLGERTVRIPLVDVYAAAGLTDNSPESK